MSETEKLGFRTSSSERDGLSWRWPVTHLCSWKEFGYLGRDRENDGCWRRRRVVLVLAAIWLSGRATGASNVSGFEACPLVVEHSREFQVRVSRKIGGDRIDAGGLRGYAGAAACGGALSRLEQPEMSAVVAHVVRYARALPIRPRRSKAVSDPMSRSDEGSLTLYITKAVCECNELKNNN